MNIETAQKLIENLGGTEKAKEIIKNCPKECTIYREAIGSTIIKEIPIGVIATALAVLEVDYGQPFEPPPKRKEPKEIIKAMFDNGWEYVPCYDVHSFYQQFLHKECEQIKECLAPFDPKTGKTIIDYVDGEVVLEG